jgi:hypothetical protein
VAPAPLGEPTTVVLGEPDWRDRRAAHEARVDVWTADRLARRREGVKHPVDDFLFDYYAFRPGQLRSWHPGFGVVLAGSSADEYLRRGHYVRAAHGVTVGAEQLARHTERLCRTRDLLVRTASRPPSTGCFGLHEWAMVYRLEQTEVRHGSWPLRLSPEEIVDVVDSQGLRCTHFDAFRFFTPAAEPLNATRPSAARRADQEQPGCLHASMDLYKWSFQLHSFVASELIADCFELAREIRALDMRAAPYDLSALGYQPVRVETADGRAEFVAAQRAFRARAATLRARLVDHYEQLLALSEGQQPSVLLTPRSGSSPAASTR